MTKNERKLALLRRADTERDSADFATAGERKRETFIERKAITLPRVKWLERPMEEDEP